MLFPEVKIVEVYNEYMKMAVMPVRGWVELKATRFPYSKRPAAIFYRRGESLAEHQAKTALLARLFLDHFPGYFSEKNYIEDKILDIVTFPLIKNVGQAETGNLVKDGRIYSKKKKEKVWSKFCEFVRLAFSDSAADSYSLIYRSYESSDDHLGKALSALSMLEHVLMLAYLEKQGYKMDIYGRKTRTNRVRMLIKKCKSYDALDVFAVDMVLRVSSFPKEIKRPIYHVLREAILVARGEFFPWWHNVVKVDDQQEDIQQESAQQNNLQW